MTFRSPVSILCGAFAMSLGCSATNEVNGTSTAGTGGTSSVPSSGGSAGAHSGAAGAAGTIQGGASGTSTGGAAAGASGSGAPAGGAAGATTQGGAAGAQGGGNAGAAGAAGSVGQGGSGPGGKASCADNTYDLCLDFETPIDTAKWTGGTQGAVISTDSAHGGHGYRLYPMSGGKLVATNLGKITNQMWGRFYVHFKPGAPGGHGNIVAAFDMSNNWYEMGWQFDGMMGVWHASNNGERPLRSKPYIVDQWYCIETFFDGTKTEMPKWWIDGAEAQYYMSANEQLVPKVVTQFARVEVGFSPYAGFGLMLPDQTVIKDDRVLTDMTIDDVAFNTTRIGCIAP